MIAILEVAKWYICLNNSITYSILPLIPFFILLQRNTILILLSLFLISSAINLKSICISSVCLLINTILLLLVLNNFMKKYINLNIALTKVVIIKHLFFI